MLKTTLSDLEKILGTTFKNQGLLIEALTHKSNLNESAKGSESNERLEFLGDSVLSLLTSTQLYKNFPTYPEGKLTNLRSILVRTQTLGKISQKLSLGEFLHMSKGEERSGGRTNLSLLADTFEAIIGAMYLDSGLETVKRFLERNLFSQIDTLSNDKSNFDYKSHLQEVTQNSERLAPTYRVTKEVGPDHAKTFTVAVYAGSKQLATGTGKSKQEAEQEAARIALEQEKS